MNIEHLLSSTPGWLLDVTLQTTLLLALAGGVTICLPRLAAARRHFIQASALLLIPAVMVCSFMTPAWRIPWGMLQTAQTAAGGQKETSKDDRDPFVPAMLTTATLRASMQDDAPPSPLWAVLWVSGIAAGALALGVSARALRRLRAASRVVQDARMQRCFQEEAAAFHLGLPGTSLRMSAECQVPMTWGLTRKTVLLPEQAMEWQETRLRLVLRHELAHIARGDVLVTLLTTLAALLLWFHPLVWLMLRACERSREQACDDLALAHSGQSANDFAEELLAAVAGLGGTTRPWLPLALAVSASAKAMRQRLASLVQAGRSRSSYSRLQKLALLLPAMAAAFGLAGLSACRKAAPTAQAQILIMSRFISIPKDSSVLAEAGLTLDANNPALQNLGILNEAQTQDLLHKLSQTKGVNLISAPSLTTHSGQKATVEVMRDFIYPTQFDPPKQATQDQPLLPTTPSAFQTKPVGVRLEVVPTLGYEDDIELTVAPEVTTFEGFIDYGTPITQAGKVVSENKVQQPIFHTLKTTAGFHMKSGQSVVFGGLGSPDSEPLTSHRPEMKDMDRKSLTSQLPKTKDLVFFIIQANTLASGTAATALKDTAVLQPAKPAVTILGQVKRQGKYSFKPGMTIQELLNQAQGLTERADAAKAQLKSGEQTTTLDLTQDSSKPLADGDTLTVQEK